MLSLAAFTSASVSEVIWVTTLLTIGLPLTSRTVAFALSMAGFDSHFMNSQLASLFLEYSEIANGIEMAYVLVVPA